MSEDKPLSDNINAYYKAVSSEFEIKQDDTVANQAREQLTGLLPDAVKALEQTLVGAESEAVRMSAIKLVIEYTVGKPGNISNEDELSKLINMLSAPKASKKDKTQ